MGEVGRDVKGYSLSPGILSEMADRICDFV